MHTLMAVLLSIVSVTATVTQPLIRLSATKDGFDINYQHDARWVCVVYELQEPLEDYPNGYKPASCNGISRQSTWYTDTAMFDYIEPLDRKWVVYAVVGYTSEWWPDPSLSMDELVEALLEHGEQSNEMAVIH